MTARLLLLLSLSAVPARASVRALMENLQASNTSFFLATATQRLGINNASPKASIDIIKNVGFSNVGASTGSTVNLWDGVGAVTGGGFIGFGYQGIHVPAAFGWTATSGAGNTSGDFVWLNRIGTADVRPGEQMRLTNLGNLGIGTGATGAKIQIATSTFSNDQFRIGDVGATNFWYFSRDNVSTGKLAIGTQAGQKVTIDPDGSITGVSSITGSAFFGNGSALTNLPGVVFTSTYAVAGTDRALGTTPVGIATCTLTTNGGRLHFNVVSDLHVASANDKPKLGITIDGAFMDPYSTFSGAKRFNVWGNNNGADSNGSFSFDTTAVVAAGAHTFVLVGYAETGTSIVYCGSAVDHPYCLMQVTETK